jgi:hypothetical protein
VVQLGSSNPTDQLAAAEGLWAMSYDPLSAAAIVAAPGVLSSLVALLASSNSSAVQRTAAKALQHLAFGNPNSGTAIAATPGALSSLVDLFNSSNSDVQDAASDYCLPWHLTQQTWQPKQQCTVRPAAW